MCRFPIAYMRAIHPCFRTQPSEKPIPELITQINAIWHRKGIKPKQHLSEPCPGAETVMEKRKHADRCKVLPPDLPDDMDLMIEVRPSLCAYTKARLTSMRAGEGQGASSTPPVQDLQLASGHPRQPASGEAAKAVPSCVCG